MQHVAHRRSDEIHKRYAEIERKRDRMVSHLNNLLLSGDLSQRAYNFALIDLNRWTTAKQKELADHA